LASGHSSDPLDPFLYHSQSTSQLSWATITSLASQWRPFLAELPHWWHELSAAGIMQAFSPGSLSGHYRIPC
jgi:hypothetical protein